MVLGPSAGNSGPQAEQAGNRQCHHAQYIVAHAAVVFRWNGDGNEGQRPETNLAAWQMLLQPKTKRPPEGGLSDLDRALKPTQLPFFDVARQSVRLAPLQHGGPAFFDTISPLTLELRKFPDLGRHCAAEWQRGPWRIAALGARKRLL